MSNPKNSFRKKTFGSPNRFNKQTDEVAEEFDRNRSNWSAQYWKPKKGKDNQIRILPQIGEASWHLKIGKHFVRHEDGTEVFVCPLMTHGSKCPACEKYNQLIKVDKKAAAEYRVTGYGVFNVIDRDAEEDGVKSWEAPPSMVWRPVIEWQRGNGKFNNIVGTEENPLEGRDLYVNYKPDETPANKYRIWPDETSVLGTPEQIALWLAEAKPLIAEELYPEVSYDIAYVKTFGTPQEREELRQALREAYQAKEEEEEEDSSEVERLKKELAEANAAKKVAEVRAATLEKKSPEEKAIEASAEARAAKEEDESKEESEPEEKVEKKTSPKAKETSIPEDVARKVAKIRAQHLDK